MDQSKTDQRSATLIGFTAILMWSLLALFSASSGSVPPFQLASMTFLLGGSLGVTRLLFRSNAVRNFKQDWRVWALGIGGLFGYHLIYFTAIRITPAVEVSLIAYLWPLFLVVFSTFLPNEKLHRHHVVGVIMGLSGAGLIISKGNISGVFQNFSFGHLLAFICAVIWASYSVLSRRFRNAPVELVSGFCLATAALSLIAHLVFETTVWPQLPTQWLAVLGLGLLPVGLAFYTWDYGVKHGDIMVLGAASYAAPLLSTLVLVSVGHTIFTWIISAGCLLITAGAVIAAKDMISKKPI